MEFVLISINLHCFPRRAFSSVLMRRLEQILEYKEEKGKVFEKEQHRGCYVKSNISCTKSDKSFKSMEHEFCHTPPRVDRRTPRGPNHGPHKPKPNHSNQRSNHQYS
ncbi:hypothetical protein Dimus_005127 [Dionaea muscipula]